VTLTADVVFQVVAKYPLNPVSPGQKDPFPINEIIESIKTAGTVSSLGTKTP